jgi:hypothetical protein
MERSVIANDPLDDVRRLGGLLPSLDDPSRERVWHMAVTAPPRASARRGGRALLVVTAAALALAMTGVAVAEGWLDHEPASGVDQLPVETTPYTGGFVDGMAHWQGGQAPGAASLVNHIAMRDLGEDHEALEIGRRASDGSVCFRLHGGGTCTLLDNPGHLSGGLFRMRREKPLQIFGAVDDDVRGVDVIVAGTAVPARVENDGFYLELPEATRDRDIDAFVSVFADGTRVTTPLPWGNP